MISIKNLHATRSDGVAAIVFEMCVNGMVTYCTEYGEGLSRKDHALQNPMTGMTYFLEEENVDTD